MIKNKSFIIGIIMLSFLLLIMVIGPYLPFVEQEITEETLRISEDGFERAPFPPSSDNPFGTDSKGRDLLSLVIHGAKDTIFIVLLITLIRYFVAIPLALAAISEKGPFYWLMSGWNRVFSALPPIFSAILLMNIPFFVFSDHRLIAVIIILAFIEVGRVSYILQQEGRGVANSLYVEAGVTIGNTSRELAYRYYFPALLPSIIVNFFSDLGKVLILIGQLGVFSIFITQTWIQLGAGFGEIQNTSYNWATLLGETRTSIRSATWIPLFPALAITYTVIGFYLIGEGLRAHFNR